MKAKKVLLYTPLIEWYLQHGLKLTAVDQLIEYEPGMPFLWFPQEVKNAWREADKDPLKKHMKKGVLTRPLGLCFFDNLEEISGAYEIIELKRTVMINRPYQCGIALYQLAKLRMLEFYYDFWDKYFSRQDFELCYMDTDSFYLAMSGDSFDEIVSPEMKQLYRADQKNWLATDKFRERTPGLLKPEFLGTRGVRLTAKWYLVQDEAGENNYSCKGVSKKHNDLHLICGIKMS